MKLDLSVVIPIFNEEENIPKLHKGLKEVIKNLKVNHEIIFINDGSIDNSENIVRKIIRKDKKTKLISFSRNFGHMQAISAGLTHSMGQKVVIMDADLQDPPEVINDLWKKSEEGFNIVYAIKSKRKENFLKKFLFTIFYNIITKISRVKMPKDAGTFSIIDRKSVDVIISLPERNKYFSGLRAWTGFSQGSITYERGRRIKGKSKSITKLIGMGLDGIFSFSYLPLRLASLLGFIFASIAFAFIVFVLVARFIFDKGIVGWASTMSTILLIGGVQLITLGIIGEYLARIYDEVKNRPEYIIAEKIGFKKK